MTKPTVSIIMPVFNAETYIRESVQCILSQTLKDLELVIVDDCSQDNTWNIIQEISQKDGRCRCFLLDKNSGSAKYPRDFAAKMSVGNFVCWIDADDKVPSNYIERLVKRQEETQADIVCSKMLAFDSNDNIIYTLPRENFNYGLILDGKKAVMLTIGKEWRISVNGFMSKREIWTSTEHFLDRSVVQMNADDYASREMLLASSKVAFCNVEYYYRLHQQSITKAISHKLFEPLITDWMVIGLLKRYFNTGSAEIAETWNQYFFHWISMMRIFVLNKDRLKGESYRIAKSLLKEHKRRFPVMRIFKDKKVPFSQKVLLMLPIHITELIVKKINK